MLANSKISDILPARPVRDAQKPRPEVRDGAFSQVLSGAQGVSEVKVAEGRPTSSRRDEDRVAPPRSQAADSAREAQEAPQRRDVEAPPAAEREPAKAHASAEKPEAPLEREAAPEPAAAPSAPGDQVTVPTASPAASPVSDASGASLALANAVAGLPGTEAGEAGTGEVAGGAGPSEAVANPLVDAAQVNSALVTGGQANGVQANIVQATAGQVTADAAFLAGQTAAVAAGVAGAVGALQGGSPGSATAEAAAGNAPTGGVTKDTAPAKGDDAAKAAVRTEATQGFAAQLAAQAAAGATDGAKGFPDGVQALSSPQSGAAVNGASSAPATTPQQGLARADAPVPLQALAVEIGMRAMRGAKEFAIRLDPEDMGRVDIRLEISEKGEVQAKVMVERVETLHLLQRDARTLERAFDQAGLKTNPDGLQFSLKDPGQQSQNNGREPGGQSRSGRGGANEYTADEALPPVSAIYRAPGLGALDIRI